MQAAEGINQRVKPTSQGGYNVLLKFNLENKPWRQADDWDGNGPSDFSNQFVDPYMIVFGTKTLVTRCLTEDQSHREIIEGAEELFTGLQVPKSLSRCLSSSISGASP